MARWAPFSGPGGFADADMPPLGRIGIRAERGADRMSLLTEPEQRTMMTLWSVSRSPLFVGGDLPTSNPETISLLTNAVVLDVNSRSEKNTEHCGNRTILCGPLSWTDALWLPFSPWGMLRWRSSCR
ncbi:hypothetical protein [Arthrobacter sp. H5]|uniref:hypothetical protein n=1 Tax=Arthrobacter sp. H5 TaxID=1267973 RepID=UPI0020A6D597|nr:hypothetical protein [Arthrobacter sp. H5]